MRMNSPLFRRTGAIASTLVTAGLMFTAAPVRADIHSPINGPGPGAWKCKVKLSTSGQLICTLGNKTWIETVNEGLSPNDPGHTDATKDQCTASLIVDGRTVAVGTGPCIYFQGLGPVESVD